MELSETKEGNETLKKQVETLTKEKDEVKETLRKITAERDAERIQKEQSNKEKSDVSSSGVVDNKIDDKDVEVFIQIPIN